MIACTSRPVYEISVIIYVIVIYFIFVKGRTAGILVSGCMALGPRVLPAANMVSLNDRPGGGVLYKRFEILLVI